MYTGRMRPTKRKRRMQSSSCHQCLSTAHLSLVKFRDLGNDELLCIDRELDLIPRFGRLEKRWSAHLVAHRHGVHKPFDLSVLENDLVAFRYDSDYFPLGAHRLRHALGL